ncbi:O-acetylhomoserine/O-acetylserine sulfhydrylase-like pyridoxal-dependent enzyme [Paraburkholderia sp. 35.1]
MDDFHDFDFDTLAVRSGTVRSDFNEHSEAIFLTSSFVFASAADAAERFRNSEDYFTLLALLEPDRVDVPGPSGRARRRRGLHRDGFGHGRDHVGRDVDVADGRSPRQLAGAVRLDARHVLADLQQVRHYANALFVVDSCFCSPALQQPLKLGADVVMHSATRFLDG